MKNGSAGVINSDTTLHFNVEVVGQNVDDAALVNVAKFHEI